MAKGNGYHRVTWDTLQDYPGETSRIYSGPLACENFAFLVNRQLPGKGGSHHAHDGAEEVYVLLQGEAVLRVGDEDIAMKPLDAVRVQPQVLHSTRNESTEDALWLVIGAPTDEFIDFDPVAYGPPADD
jgi:oxalate decarboxylase/phosphoglucose isomerase-like protein (cupin superfamily)